MQISTTPSGDSFLQITEHLLETQECNSRDDHLGLLSRKGEDCLRAITFPHPFIFKGTDPWKGFSKSWGAWKKLSNFYSRTLEPN